MSLPNEYNVNVMVKLHFTMQIANYNDFCYLQMDRLCIFYTLYSVLALFSKSKVEQIEMADEIKPQTTFSIQINNFGFDKSFLFFHLQS